MATTGNQGARLRLNPSVAGAAPRSRHPVIAPLHAAGRAVAPAHRGASAWVGGPSVALRLGSPTGSPLLDALVAAAVVAVALLSFLAGVAWLWRLLRDLRRAGFGRPLVATLGTVVGVTPERERAGIGRRARPTRRVAIAYDYAVAGRSYRGTTVRPVGRGDAAAWWTWPVAARDGSPRAVTVYYDAEHPAWATLVPRPSWIVVVGRTAVAALLLWLGVLLGVALALRAYG